MKQLVWGVLLLAGCSSEVVPEPLPQPDAATSYCDTAGDAVNFDPSQPACEKLSGYRLFKGNGYSQEPNEGVIPYEMNTPLFTDYAAKRRFIWMPKGSSAKYTETGVLKFPQGTVIAKTFSYPKDFRSPAKDERILETRLLVNGPDGWVGLPYIWNDDKSDAVLTIQGATIATSFVDEQGEKNSIKYGVPNSNQCKACHKGLDGMGPIGPKVRNLNRLNTYAGVEKNQLEALVEAGYLTGLPDLAAVPKTAVWNDPATSVTLDERARAYLDNNCAHCHNPRGPARTSGLDLDLNQTDPGKFGVCKPPVAAGKGAGDFLYDIVPSQPDQSILIFRLNTNDPGIMMPELGRSLIHTEGLALLRDWIAAMPPDSCLN